MQDNIQIFENKEFGKVRIIEIDDQPWFVGKDVTDILGYGNGSRDLNRHVDEEDRRNYRNGTSEINNRGVTIINESGLYSLILSSKLPQAKAFKRWVTSEILPATRKHGAYISEEALQRMKEDSQFVDELIIRLTNEREKTGMLLNYVEHTAPKIRYYDIILQCPGAVQPSILAKDYGLSAIAFNKLLKKLGIQYKIGKTWLLYSEHQGKGYTITKTYSVNEKITAIHTCWTQRGRFWLYDVLKSHGILPEAEKMTTK